VPEDAYVPGCGLWLSQAPWSWTATSCCGSSWRPPPPLAAEEAQDESKMSPRLLAEHREKQRLRANRSLVEGRVRGVRRPGEVRSPSALLPRLSVVHPGRASL